MDAYDIERITKRYRALCELVPLKPITSKAEYETAVGHLNRLLDADGAVSRITADLSAELKTNFWNFEEC